MNQTTVIVEKPMYPQPYGYYGPGYGYPPSYYGGGGGMGMGGAMMTGMVAGAVIGTEMAMLSHDSYRRGPGVVVVDNHHRGGYGHVDVNVNRHVDVNVNRHTHVDVNRHTHVDVNRHTHVNVNHNNHHGGDHHGGGGHGARRH